MKMIYRLSFIFTITLLLFQKVDGQQTIYFEDSDFNFKPLLLDGKTTEIRNAFTLSDGTYWVNHVGETGVLVKYEGSAEVYRSEQTIYLNYNERPLVFPDNSIWVQMSAYSVVDTNTIYSYRRKFLVIDSENVESVLDEGEVFDGGRFLYYDKYKNQYYAIGDSLRRYNVDFSRDYTFKCDVPLAGIGTVLVNKYGNVFLGNDKYGLSYNFNRTTYKLDHNGKVIWEGLINKKRNYSSSNWGDYNIFYPLYEKDDFVLWGSLQCGEGCYTADNHALTENDERVELAYLKKVENEYIGFDFIDNYSVTLKNGNRFMKYDSLNHIFDIDRSVVIDLHGKSIRGVFPDSSILVKSGNDLKRYTTKTNLDITTEIVNLNEASSDFFNKEVIDVRGKEIDLEVATSDSSESYVFLQPEDTEAAYLVEKRLVFTGREGDFKVLAYSFTGSSAYKSREFKVRKTDAEIEVITTGPFYINVPIEFETVQSNVYMDSVSGSCINSYKTITATSYSDEGCTIYYSWAGDENYAKRVEATSFEISRETALGTGEFLRSDILSYPNPVTNGKSFIITSKEPIFSLMAVDALGRKQIIKSREIGKDLEVTVADSFSGILFIQMFDKKNKSIGSIKKVID